MVGPVAPVKNLGSSERGSSSGSGPVLGVYPHEDNGTPGGSAPGPVGQPDQHLGVPTLTRGPDEVVHWPHATSEQVGVR